MKDDDERTTCFFFFQAEDGIRDVAVTGVQTCALPVAGDFNHSGHLGLAVVDTSNAATYMLLGNGDGTFAPSSAAFARSPLFDVTLATADLNEIGRAHV